MPYFTMRRVFPSFDPVEEEQAQLDRFMALPERSGVGEIIEKYVNNKSAKGRRPNRNYHRLFAFLFDLRRWCPLSAREV